MYCEMIALCSISADRKVRQVRYVVESIVEMG